MVDTKTTETTIESIADALHANKHFKTLNGVAEEGATATITQIENAISALKGKKADVSALKAATKTLQSQANDAVNNIAKLAESQQNTAHGGAVETVLGKKGLPAKFYEDIAKKIGGAVEPSASVLEAVASELETLAKQKDSVTPEALEKIVDTLTHATTATTQAARNARFSIAQEYLNIADKYLKDDALKTATRELSESFALEKMLKGVGVEGLEGAESAAKYLRDATKGYAASFGGMLKADGFIATVKHTLGNPLKGWESATHAIGGAENTIGRLGHIRNTAVSLAGVGMIGDAMLRSKNSENEDRAPGTRITQAVLGTAVAAAPLLKSVRL